MRLPITQLLDELQLVLLLLISKYLRKELCCCQRLRYKAKDRLDRENKIVDEVAEKHKFSGFIRSIKESIEAEMNLGGSGGEVKTSKSTQSIFLY